MGEEAKSGKAIIFRADAKSFGQKPAAKNEKMYLLNAEKRNSVRPARCSARNPGFY